MRHSTEEAGGSGIFVRISMLSDEYVKAFHIERRVMLRVGSRRIDFELGDK